MAACREEIKNIIEWHCEDKEREDAEIGIELGDEEARRLTRNEAWFSCKKVKRDANYHRRYLPLKDALGFRHFTSEDKETFAKDKRLADEDVQFLESEEALKCLERFSDAVVCVEVKKTYGTGFFIKMGELCEAEEAGDVVITNSHTIRLLGSGIGTDFSTVDPADVRVISFYNDGAERGQQVSREVTRIGMVSPPDKNKDKDILLRKVKAALYGDGTAVTETQSEVISIFDQLAPVLSLAEGFLDYAVLFLKPLDNEEEKRKFSKLRPLEIKTFEPRTYSHLYRNRSYFELSPPESPTFPRSLRLFIISHPHHASKQVSFGAMESTLQHAYLLNQVASQNDTDWLEGKDAFLEHSVPTCPGSSGAPIFMYSINHEDKEVEIDEVAYFLHFFGGVEPDGKLLGKAVSFGTILQNLTYGKINKHKTGRVCNDTLSKSVNTEGNKDDNQSFSPDSFSIEQKLDALRRYSTQQAHSKSTT